MLDNSLFPSNHFPSIVRVYVIYNIVYNIVRIKNIYNIVRVCIYSIVRVYIYIYNISIYIYIYI